MPDSRYMTDSTDIYRHNRHRYRHNKRTGTDRDIDRDIGKKTERKRKKRHRKKKREIEGKEREREGKPRPNPTTQPTRSGHGKASVKRSKGPLGPLQTVSHPSRLVSRQGTGYRARQT